MLGYGPTQAVFDGQQAINELERRSFDLILLDLQMPVLDGYSTHKQILKTYGTPSAGGPCVIALSANVDQVSRL
jgi:CheY-like chemotaxis protein